MTAPSDWLTPLIDINALAVDYHLAPFHLRQLVRVAPTEEDGPSLPSVATCPFYGRVVSIEHTSVILRSSSNAINDAENDRDSYAIIGLPARLTAYNQAMGPTLQRGDHFCYLVHETTATGGFKGCKIKRENVVEESKGKWVVARAMTVIADAESELLPMQPELSEDGVQELPSQPPSPGLPSVRPAHRKHRPLLRCVLCSPPATFLNEVSLYSHFVDHHGVYSCMYCRATCEGLEAELLHRGEHSGGLPMVCQFCGKGFQLRVNLQNHERVHTGERPFPCQHCGRTFAERNNCRRHEDKCGTGELASSAAVKEEQEQRPRLFSCPLCPRSFHRRDLLRDHERIHSGSQPFVCRRCGNRFTQRAHRLTHEKRHCK